MLGYGIVVIKRHGNGYVVQAELTYAKPYTLTLTRRSDTRFNLVDGPMGDYFAILKNGRLSMRDVDGEARKCCAGWRTQHCGSNSSPWRIANAKHLALLDKSTEPPPSA